ncbi:hypothetical protein K2X33_12625 [bacterium]|nr:hypothetical protein [bacterium]
MSKYFLGLAFLAANLVYAADPPECRTGYLLSVVNEFILSDGSPLRLIEKERSALEDRLEKDGNQKGSETLLNYIVVAEFGFSEGLRNKSDLIQNRFFMAEDGVERGVRLARAEYYGEYRHPPALAYPRSRRVEVNFILERFGDLSKPVPANVRADHKLSFDVTQASASDPVRMDLVADPADRAEADEVLKAFSALQYAAVFDLFKKIQPPDATQSPELAARYALAQAIQKELVNTRREDVLNVASRFREIAWAWQEIAKAQGVCSK